MASPKSTLIRYKGEVSLFLAVSGLLTSVLLFGDSRTLFALMIVHGFEAGTVGALADWLAVKMLFDEIRIGRFRLVPASGIIPRKQGAIAKGAGKLVAEEWLSPASVQEFMRGVDFASALSAEWKAFRNSSSYSDLQRHFRQSLAALMADTQVRRNLADWVQTRFSDVQLSRWFTKHLTPVDVEKATERLLPPLLQRLNEIVQTPDFHEAILTRVQAEQKGFLKQLFFDPVDITDSIQRQIVRFLNDIEFNRDHTVRRRVDEAVYRWLQSDDLDRWIQNAGSTFDSVWIDRVLDTLAASLGKESDGSVHWSDRMLNEVADQIERYIDGAGQKTINETLRNATGRLLASYHSNIAALVESNIARLSPDEIKNQFKARTYDDMQWIRVNGAVAGFLLGCMIGLLRYFFS